MNISKKTVGVSEVPLPDAFLEEAKKEPKRLLISDHIKTINLLRNEKRFTFREIAEWFEKRGFDVDQSAIYRAYMRDIPDNQRDPYSDWSDIDQPE